MLFGAIDIGSNASRLLIAEVIRMDGICQIEKKVYARIPTRLGDSVYREGIITEEKKEVFDDAMAAFKKMLSLFDVNNVMACATASVREAKNGEEIIRFLNAKHALPIQIISGDEEATLLTDVFPLLGIDTALPFVWVDVGGGSTEISIYENGIRKSAASFPIGTVRILNNHRFDSIKDEIKSWISTYFDKETPHRFFATGGNINKTSKVMKLKPMDVLSVDKLKKFHHRLSRLTIQERIEKFKFKPDRADVIVPALDIYLFIADILKANSITIPKIGLSDGMVLKMHSKMMLMVSESNK